MSGGCTGLNWIELGGEAVDGPGATFFTACGPYGAQRNQAKKSLGRFRV